MRVRFVDIDNNIDLNKSMKCPKKVELIDEWFKAARKAIKEIPKDYQRTCIHMDSEKIVFQLSEGKRHLCYVAIDRRTSL